jgi:hypothetical protein
MPTVCPNCDAADSLYQEVELRSSASRKVEAKLVGAEPTISFGQPDTGVFPEIEDEHEIECNACHETWDSAEALAKGHVVEWRCNSCDWWGFNSFQHNIERVSCTGSIHRADKPSAAVA